MGRKDIQIGNVYHIVTRSIAKYKIFSSERDCSRFIQSMIFFQKDIQGVRFATFIEFESARRKKILDSYEDSVQIIAYCIMPTHIHLILVQKKDGAISKFMNNVLNSYTRYFNTKVKRKGPLWESRFKSIAVRGDEQLLHLTRYIHLNPVSVGLIKKPEGWKYSSYNEYIRSGEKNRICNWGNLLKVNPASYKEFVEERIEDQKELSKIKKVLIENYSG